MSEWNIVGEIKLICQRGHLRKLINSEIIDFIHSISDVAIQSKDLALGEIHTTKQFDLTPSISDYSQNYTVVKMFKNRTC